MSRCFLYCPPWIILLKMATYISRFKAMCLTHFSWFRETYMLCRKKEFICPKKFHHTLLWNFHEIHYRCFKSLSKSPSLSQTNLGTHEFLLDETSFCANFGKQKKPSFRIMWSHIIHFSICGFDVSQKCFLW